MPSFGVSSPFLPPDGDVVLRSADGHEFYVAKNILTIASPFFRSMFSLPQPEDPGDVPTISVSEDGKTFDILLRFCYPVKNPVVEDLSLAGTVLAAALKYEMEIAVQSICRVLVSEKALGTQGLRVYAIACQHELIEETRLAAMATLRAPIEDVYIEEFETMPTVHYLNLLKFHRRVKDEICFVLWSAIGDVVRSSDFNSENPTKEVESIICRCTSRGPLYRESSCNGVASWWKKFIGKVIIGVRTAPLDPYLLTENKYDFYQVRCDTCKNIIGGQWNFAVASLRDLINKKVTETAEQMSFWYASLRT